MNKLLFFCLSVFVSFISYGQKPNEKDLRDYFEKSVTLDQLEGIWKVETKQEFYHLDTLYDVKALTDSEVVAIVKNNDCFTAFYLKGDSFNLSFTFTDVKGVYMYSIYFPLTSAYSKKQAVICMHGNMEYTYDLPDDYASKICGKDYRPDTRIVNILNWKKVFPAKQQK